MNFFILRSDTEILRVNFDSVNASRIALLHYNNSLKVEEYTLKRFHELLSGIFKSKNASRYPTKKIKVFQSIESEIFW